MIKNILVFLFLLSCNFTPIYSENNQLKNRLLHNISFNYSYDNLSLEQKIILRNFTNELAKFRSNGTDSQYKLKINNIREVITPITLNKDGIISSYNYAIKLQIIFTDGNKILLKEQLGNSLNYEVDNGYYASPIAIKKFRIDLVKNIAAEFENKILLF